MLPSGVVPAKISARELDVLRLAALGLRNSDIADQLRIAVKTVEVHKANAMGKLQLRGRADLMRFAMNTGWLQVLIDQPAHCRWQDDGLYAHPACRPYLNVLQYSTGAAPLHEWQFCPFCGRRFTVTERDPRAD